MRAPSPIAATLATIAVALLVPGCLPDFRVFTLTDAASEPEDADPPADADPDEPRVDADPPDGGSGWDNPLDLGAACDDPHLALAFRSSSGSGPGRLLHFNVRTGGTLTECHESRLAREQGAFGTGVNAVTGLPPSGRQVLSVRSAVVALDEEGLPVWRWQLWDDSDAYYYADVFPLLVDGEWSIGVVHCGSYCYGDDQGLLVLDADGQEVTHVDDLDTYSSGMPAAGPHPDGSGRLVMASGYDGLRVFTVTGSTTALDADTAPFLGGGEGFEVTGIGSLGSLEVDDVTGTLIAVYQNAIVPWRDGAALPTSGRTCATCRTYTAAAVDPTDASAYFVVCSTGSRDSLVWMRGTTCDLVLDGTTMSDHLMVDVALIRGTLD